MSSPAPLVEPLPGQPLAAEDFETIVRLTPLVSIDLIVRAPDGRILLGRRRRPPAQNTLFVPGGRISKNETRQAAFRRITRAELGVECSLAEGQFRGVYDHIYPDNFSGQGGFGTHYVVLAYELRRTLDTAGLPKEQHGQYVWLSESALLGSREVHPNTKAYFRSGLPPGAAR